MNNYYTDDEIRTIWRNAKVQNKEQIKTLSELCLCENKKICDIVGVDHEAMFNTNKIINKEQPTYMSAKKKYSLKILAALTDYNSGMKMADVIIKHGVSKQSIYSLKYRKKKAAEKAAATIKKEKQAEPEQVPSQNAVKQKLEQAKSLMLTTLPSENSAHVDEALARVVTVLNGVSHIDSMKLKAAALLLVKEIIQQASDRVEV